MLIQLLIYYFSFSYQETNEVDGGPPRKKRRRRPKRNNERAIAPPLQPMEEMEEFIQMPQEPPTSERIPETKK